MNKLSVVIPVFNSQDTLEALVTETIKTLKNSYLTEIILVNDGSKDNSEQICTRLHFEYPQIVKFYSLSKNFGEHNAVMAGLNNATGDFTIIADDDFQNPPQEIKKLADFAFSHSYDVVYTHYPKKKHNFFRNLGSKINDKIANWLLKKPKNLYLSSFKAISRFVTEHIIKYDLPYPYIDGLILRTTDNIGSIEVLHNKRLKGKSQYNLLKLIALWLNMVTNFSIKPLRIATFLGFTFSILGFLLAVAGVLMKFFEPGLPLGYASLLITVSILGGIQLIAIGILGEYLGRTFISLSKQPQYIIKKRLETKKD